MHLDTRLAGKKLKASATTAAQIQADNSDLAPCALPSSAAAARRCHFTAGEAIFRDGEQATHVCEILRGVVRCYRVTSDGRRHIFRLASKGDIIGQGSGTEFDYSAEAVGEVVVQKYRLASLACDVRLQEQAMAALCDELAAMRRQTIILGQMRAAERVALFLLDLADRSRTPDGLVRLPARRQDIADYLGMKLETVSRQLGELRRRGIISLPSVKTFRILDRARLEVVAPM